MKTQKLTPLWKLKKRMRELHLEREIIVLDPEGNEDIINDIEQDLNQLKREYAERVARLKGARVGG